MALHFGKRDIDQPKTLNQGMATPRYGQSTGVCVFDRVFVPWDRVFYAGEWEHSGHLTYSYATHHRHSCIGARAGFGDLLIGASALMAEANGFEFGGALLFALVEIGILDGRLSLELGQHGLLQVIINCLLE